MDFQEFLQHIPSEVIQHLGEINLNIQSENCQREINRLLQRTVLLGGKRLRPLLTHLMGNLFEAPVALVQVLATAIEQVHAASLSHDDVVDNASSRRDNPSINMLSGNKRAVLAGDYLLANVIMELCRLENKQIVSSMAQVIEDLAVGEWLQLDACQNREYSREILTKIAQMKTASVMSWCTYSCSLLTNRPSAIQDYAKKFGENLGLAFQLLDDTLDFSSSSLKDRLLDLENGQVNMVIYEWLELHPKIKHRYLAGEEIRDLFTAERINEAIQTVRSRADAHLESARQCLGILAQEMGFDASKMAPLYFITDYLGQRTH